MKDWVVGGGVNAEEDKLLFLHPVLRLYNQQV